MSIGTENRRAIEVDIRKWTGLPLSTLNKCSGQAIDLIWTACVAAMQTQRDKVLPNIRTACAIIELGDQRLMAADGPCGGEPPKISLDEWRTMYKQLDKARKHFENDPVTAQ